MNRVCMTRWYAKYLVLAGPHKKYKKNLRLIDDLKK